MNTLEDCCLKIFFSNIEDPRIDRTRLHNLIDILFVAICASIAGADSWYDIAMFGRVNAEWFCRYLELPNGIPSHDTFARVFSLLDTKKLNQCFIDWINMMHTVSKGEIIAIDGKTIRNSFDKSTETKALHMVSAWAKDASIVLGQVKTDQKSNEITAIPKLLDLLSIKGAIVTIDAIGCQKNIASKIVEKKADYVLAVKNNQKSLRRDIEDGFKHAQNIHHIFPSYSEADKGHGRIETRTIDVINSLDWAPATLAWPGAKSICRLTSTREIKGKISSEKRYYISSLSGNPSDFARAIRGHWGIENCLHWVLDVTFNEDKCRTRKWHAPENLSLLRKVTMNMLKADPEKASIKGKRKMAGWSKSYLEKVLWKK